MAKEVSVKWCANFWTSVSVTFNVLVVHTICDLYFFFRSNNKTLINYTIGVTQLLRTVCPNNIVLANNKRQFSTVWWGCLWKVFFFSCLPHWWIDVVSICQGHSTPKTDNKLTENQRRAVTTICWNGIFETRIRSTHARIAIIKYEVWLPYH